LIELLLAISILSAMLALLFGAFSQITGGAVVVQDQADERQRIRLLVGLIADDLAAAKYLKAVADPNATSATTGIVADTEFVQDGEFTRVDFHAEVPARFHRALSEGQDPELHEVSYRVRQSEDRERLELARREDFYLDDDLRNGGIEAPLLANIKTFLVEFLPEDGKSTNEDAENWLEEWNSKDRTEDDELPAAIRLTLTVLGQNGRELGETVVVNLPPKTYKAGSGDNGAGTGSGAASGGTAQ
jgi:type II secretory pathway component PulJ